MRRYWTWAPSSRKVRRPASQSPNAVTTLSIHTLHCPVSDVSAIPCEKKMCMEMKTMVTPMQKLMVRACPKRSADMRPVKMVAIVEEYFFSMVSAYLKKKDDRMPCRALLTINSMVTCAAQCGHCSAEVTAAVTPRHAGSAGITAAITLRHAGSAKLTATGKLGHAGSAELIVAVWLRHAGSEELTSAVRVRHAGSAELTAAVKLRHAGSAGVTAALTQIHAGSAEVTAAGKVRHAGSAEVTAAVRLRHADTRTWTDRWTETDRDQWVLQVCDKLCDGAGRKASRQPCM